MSNVSIPEKSLVLSSLLLNRLSINVAVSEVIRVGLVIFGMSEWAKLILRNSLVGG